MREVIQGQSRLLTNCWIKGAQLETIQLLKALRSDPEEDFVLRDIMGKLCPEDALKPHRMKAEQARTELWMSSSLILSSMEDACRRWNQLKQPTRLIQLQKDEAIEFERMRSSVIF